MSITITDKKPTIVPNKSLLVLRAGQTEMVTLMILKGVIAFLVINFEPQKKKLELNLEKLSKYYP